MTTQTAVSVPQVWTLVYDGVASGALVGSVYITGNMEVNTGTSAPAESVAGGMVTNGWLPVKIKVTERLYCRSIGNTYWAVVDDSVKRA